jgi:16S rRNA (uracil1498-N3)-methyltransferase
MTRRRWIADEIDLPHNRAALLGDQAAHLTRVLRARIGQEFDLVLHPDKSAANAVTPAGVRRGRIVQVTDGRVEFELGAALPAVRDSDIQINLLLAVFKFDRMEWAIEKAVELGVAQITPLLARRTEKHLALAAGKRVERWSRIAREASQQSRRDSLPAVNAPVGLKAAIQQSADTRVILAEGGLDEGGDPPALRELLDSLGNFSTFNLAVGPEGGWTADELDMFVEAGWQTASLGKNILRVETAAIAALALAASYQK